MTIIGTEEEIEEIKHQCDGRCIDGEWCIFNTKNCPIDTTGSCMTFNIIKNQNCNISVLNER